MLTIKKAAVIGAGNMGAQIAAHLANVGIPSILMDVVPTELTPEEQKRGLTLQDREVRNRVTKTLFERAKNFRRRRFLFRRTPDSSPSATSRMIFQKLAMPIGSSKRCWKRWI